jgi:hypothetical protein
MAWLMIGWLTSRLERPPQRELTVTARAHTGTAGGLTVSIDAPDVDGITVTMSEHQVEVTLASGQVPFVMSVPAESDADAIAAELWTLSRDVGLDEAVRAAHARFTRLA